MAGTGPKFSNSARNQAWRSCLIAISSRRTGASPAALTSRVGQANPANQRALWKSTSGSAARAGVVPVWMTQGPRSNGEECGLSMLVSFGAKTQPTALPQDALQCEQVLPNGVGQSVFLYHVLAGTSIWRLTAMIQWSTMFSRCGFLCDWGCSLNIHTVCRAEMPRKDKDYSHITLKIPVVIQSLKSSKVWPR